MSKTTTIQPHTKDNPTWTPRLGSTFESNSLTHEQVWFIPDVTIECSPPYIKGKPDCCWIKYRYRPVGKDEWEKALGMSLQTMR